MKNIRGTLFGCCVLLLFSQSAAPVTADDAARYSWKPQQEFAYDVTITVSAPDKTTTYTGTTRYKVLTAGREQTTIRYSGGLVEKIEYKSQPGDFRDPFGPRRFRPPFPSPFSRPRFAGKTQTTNTITISTRGAVHSIEGESQLPYLLGNVSLLPFELLPENGDQKEWIVDSGISITQGQESRRRLSPFDRFGRGQPKTVQAANESTRYELKQSTDDALVIGKSYQLSTPPTDGKPSFQANGTGTWIFDRDLHVPLSLDYEQKLVISEGNTTTTIPITIKYSLVPQDVMAERDAEAARRKEAQKAAEAEAKRIAEAPFTDQQSAKALESLASGQVASILAELTRLKAKSIPNPDPSIAAAIELLLEHPNIHVQDEATKTLVKWSPSFKRKVDADHAYRGPSPVKSTQRYVGESTLLYRGMLVQIQQNGSFWYPAEVLEVMNTGQVRLRLLGGSQKDTTTTRRQIQLGPEELTQRPNPNDPPNAPARRWWTDSTGKFRIEATFLSLKDGNVKLMRVDGKSVKIPLEKLAEKDQQLVAELTKPPPDNPFIVEESADK
jgi:hypothetical protein